LDTDERRRFAKKSHEYLIEQVQINRNSIHSKNLLVNIDLNLNHPVKEIIWVIQNTYAYEENNGLLTENDYNSYNYDIVANAADAFSLDDTNGTGDASIVLSYDADGYTPTTSPTLTNQYFYNLYDTAGDGYSLGNHIFNFCRGLSSNGVNNKDQLDYAVLKLNGSDRFRRRKSSYFRLVQRYEHHTGSGIRIKSRVKTSHGYDSIEVHKPCIYMYSFSLEPEEHQPSGTCNFSRIDNAVLHLELHKSQNLGKTADESGARIERIFRLYAINYNVLKIMSGMGGLAYKN